MKSKDELLEALARGKRFKYLHFWGHKEKKPSREVTKLCLSQWYSSPFTENGVRYATAEHYMMARKAALFNDLDNQEKIIAASNPGAAKKLGREIRNFDQENWNAHKFDIVVQGSYLKFSQDEALKEFLLSTGNRVLVEASPVDRIWGIGLEENKPEANNPFQWRGENRLGFALMVARERLRAE